MRYLAFDTSAPLGTVVVGEVPGPDQAALHVLARGVMTERAQHSSGLLPLIRDVMDEAGVRLDELAGIVVGSGPGSFTGVRVAAATAKGLVRGAGVPLHAVSSLAGGAASVGVSLPDVVSMGDFDLVDLSAEELQRPRYVLFDARADRVYAACYRFLEGRMETLVAPHASTIGAVLEGPVPSGAFFAGEGAIRHLERVKAAGHTVLAPPAGLPMAEGLLALVALDARGHIVAEPGRWAPEYFQGSSAVPMGQG